MQSPAMFFLICLLWGIGSFLPPAMRGDWSSASSTLISCVLLGLVIAGVRMMDRSRRTVPDMDFDRVTDRTQKEAA